MMAAVSASMEERTGRTVAVAADRAAGWFTDPPRSPLLSPADAPGQATHRLSLGADGRVTEEVAELLRAAYEQNG